MGENAGGKTTLLTAVARALGRDLSFGIADFQNVHLPIELQVTLIDLDLSQQAIFANYVQFGSTPSLQLRVRAIWNQDAEEADVEHGYTRQPGSRSRRNERDAIPLLWLSASRDPGRMLQFGFARNLMSQILEGLPLSQSLDEAIQSIAAAGREMVQTPELQRLLGLARNRLAALLPDVTANAFTMGSSAATPRDLLRQFNLFVEHLGEAVPVDRQSSGIAQLSTFVFAIQLAMNDPGAILLIDEPELSLHPQSQRALMRLIKDMDAQSLIATHSASLLDRVDPRSVLRLARTGSGVRFARPFGLSDEEARRLSRFASPQTAEAFFARSVILVEGLSDQLALEALAERESRNLDAEGIAIVPIGGAGAIRTHLELFGERGLGLRVAGLCDEAEEPDFIRALEQTGLGTSLTRNDMESLGFFVCVRDLEDELIRAVGASGVEQVINGEGELSSFQSFAQQPAQRSVPREEQLRRFLARGGRKIRYAPLLVDAADIKAIPLPLKRLIAHV